MQGDGLASNAEHQSTDVSQTRCESDDQDRQNDEQAEMLLPMFDPHLNKKPDDEPHQRGFDQSKQPGAFTPVQTRRTTDRTPSPTPLGEQAALCLTGTRRGGQPNAQLHPPTASG